MSLIGLLNYFEQQRGREQYGNLLNEYRQPGDSSALPLGNTPAELDQSILQQQGGFKGEGGVLSGGPPPEFYLRAAALPGYGNLAQQAQVGQQAMERQQQGQQWESSNMSLAQKTQLDMAQQQQTWERDRRQFEWNNPSAAQQANIDQGWASNAVARGNLAINQAQLGLQQQQMSMQQQQAQNERMFPALGLKGQAAMDYRGAVAKMDNAAAITTDVADYLGKIGVGGKALDRGTVHAMQAAYQQHVVPALTTMVGTGTIQKGDMEFVQGVMGDPGSWGSLDSRERQKVMQILTSVEDERARLYGLSGVKAPATQKGRSAWARSREGATSAPADTVWGP